MDRDCQGAAAPGEESHFWGRDLMGAEAVEKATPHPPLTLAMKSAALIPL